MSSKRYTDTVPHKHPFRAISVTFNKAGKPVGEVENLVTGKIHRVTFDSHYFESYVESIDDIKGTYWKRKDHPVSEEATYERISAVTAAKQIQLIADRLIERIEEKLIEDSRTELQNLIDDIQS